jgi:hypothetical protein
VVRAITVSSQAACDVRHTACVMGSCSADGDLVAMDTARAMLRLNGELLVTVPCGEVDYVVWNAQRIYGPVRLPLLLSGWEVLVAQQTPFPATSPRYITAAPDAQFVLRNVAPLRSAGVLAPAASVDIAAEL